MISRRNIRVKVMQTLYALDSQSEEGGLLDETSIYQLEKEGVKVLVQKFQRSSDLFALMLLYMARVAQYSEINARQRASKYLATEDDKKANTKIAGNKFLWDLLENATFQEKIKSDKVERYIDAEWTKKLFLQWEKSEGYQAYILDEQRDPKSEKKIMQQLWQGEMMGNENFMDAIQDEWGDWEDDKEMVEMLMENYFRSPKNVNFLLFLSVDKKEYAIELLKSVISKDDHLMSLVKPKLKNWDPERVAQIDLTLLKMGLAELLYFPTIPTKVTINEYIEIAKNYSTPQSGQFVNGVLDNLLKELTLSNKIRKVERDRN